MSRCLIMTNKYARSGSVRFSLGHNWYVSVFRSRNSVNLTLRKWKISLIGDPYPFYNEPFLRFNLSEYKALIDSSNSILSILDKRSLNNKNGIPNKNEVIFFNNGCDIMEMKIFENGCRFKKRIITIVLEEDCIRKLLEIEKLKLTKPLNQF